MYDYKEVVKRCKEQKIDIKDCDIYIYPNNLNGNLCLKGTLSKDERWICIPEKVFSYDFDDYTYIPVCHEIKDRCTTYLKGDSSWYLVTVYILYKESVNV